MRRSRFVSVASPAIAASLMSCVIVDPSCGGAGASILVTPAVVYVAVGQSTTPKATWCSNGHYDPLTPDWSLSSAADANVISLDVTTGRITGRRAGSATVIVTSEGVGGTSVSVTVR